MWWSWLVLVVVLAGAGYLLARDADDLAEALQTIGTAAFAGSTVLALLGTLTIGLVWLCLVRGAGVTVATPDAGSTFYVTQLGKYVPGSVWPIVAQASAGRRWGAAPRVMVMVNLLMLAVLGVTGLLVGVLTLPWVVDAPWASPWWLVLAPVLVGLLHPAVLPAVLGHVMRLLGRELAAEPVARGAMLRATSWALVTWGLMGLHLWLLLQSFGDVGWRGLLAMVGAMGVGWAVGLVVVIAPAGVGVRDAILVAVASTFVDASQAAAVALASRVILVLVDVALAGAGALVGALIAARSARADEH